MNSRLDTIQAAVLLTKLKAFKDYEVSDINDIARMYIEEFTNIGLDKKLVLPVVKDGYLSSWAQFTVQLPEGADRARIQLALKDQGIPTMVYYMKPMHRQGAFAGTYSSKSQCPVTDELCSRVLSLPIHPYLTRDQIIEVVSNINKYL